MHDVVVMYKFAFAISSPDEFLVLLTDLTLINVDILINNKITIKAAFKSGKCKNIITFSTNSSAS